MLHSRQLAYKKWSYTYQYFYSSKTNFLLQRKLSVVLFFSVNDFQFFLNCTGPIWKCCHEQNLTVGQVEQRLREKICVWIILLKNGCKNNICSLNTRVQYTSVPATFPSTCIYRFGSNKTDYVIISCTDNEVEYKWNQYTLI